MDPAGRFLQLNYSGEETPQGSSVEMLAESF